MSKVTYIYARDRKKNIENNTVEARELYYSFHLFKEDGNDMNIIEYETKDNFINKFLYFYDRILNKFISIPSYSHQLYSNKNKDIIKKSDYVFLVNEGVGFSALPMIYNLNKISETKIVLFSMGLLSKKVKKYFSFLHHLFIRYLLNRIDNVIFLGKGEYEIAKKTFNKLEAKFHHLNFSVDTEFWSTTESRKFETNKNILFVGNDSNKDENMVKKIAKLLPDYKFTCISKLPGLKNTKLNNLNVVDGEWNNSSVSDQDLKSFYTSSFLTIIPLKESLQPSGQSVALQSMCSGTPVLITQTDGFWDKEKFENNKHIIFIQSKNEYDWKDKILELSNNNSLIKKISSNSKSNVVNNFDLYTFHRKLKAYIDK